MKLKIVSLGVMLLLFSYADVSLTSTVNITKEKKSKTFVSQAISKMKAENIGLSRYLAGRELVYGIQKIAIADKVSILSKDEIASIEDLLDDTDAVNVIAAADSLMFLGKRGAASLPKLNKASLVSTNERIVL